MAKAHQYVKRYPVPQNWPAAALGDPQSKPDKRIDELPVEPTGIDEADKLMFIGKSDGMLYQAGMRNLQQVTDMGSSTSNIISVQGHVLPFLFNGQFFADADGNVDIPFNPDSWTSVLSVSLSVAGAVAPGQTLYCQITGRPGAATGYVAENLIGYVMPTGCRATNLFVDILGGDIPGGGNVTVSLKIRGVSTGTGSLKVVLPAGSTAQQYKNLSTIVDISAGSLLSFEINNQSAGDISFDSIGCLIFSEAA